MTSPAPWGDSVRRVGDAADAQANIEGISNNLTYLTPQTFLWSTYSRQLGAPQDARAPELAPDFFVISAGRTGTTWLAEQLRRAPRIFVPPQKEIHYFSLQWQHHDLAWYSNIFRDAAAGQIKGDISPSYACLPSFAIRLIAQLYPNLKLILVARRPQEHTWSQTRHAFRYRDSTFANVTNSLNSLPPELLLTHFLSDHVLSACDTVGIIRRWARFFPLDQFHVSYFEDVVANPEQYLNSVFRFVGNDNDPAVDPCLLNQKVNEGIDIPEPTWGPEVLADIHCDRQRQTESYLKHTFGLTSPWAPSLRAPNSQPVLLDTRGDGWRIFFYKGRFYGAQRRSIPIAEELESVPNDSRGHVLRRDFIGDLLFAIDHGSGLSTPNDAAEDYRLMSVIGILQSDSTSSPREVIGTRNGYTLIQSKQRFYAVRDDMVDMDISIGDDRLRREYRDDEVLISSSIEQLQLQLDLINLAEQLRLSDALRASDAAPEIVDTYDEFNIVRCGSSVYGVRQALGAVDFAVPTAQLLRIYSPADFICGNSVSGIRRKIDKIRRT